MKISFIIPVFSLSGHLEELVNSIENMIKFKYDWEIVLVSDGAPEQCWQIIEKLVKSHPKIRGLKLSRNFGQHTATIAGLNLSTGDICVTLDDDFENPPDQVPILLKTLIEKNLDLVYGVPKVNYQSLWRRLTSKIFRGLMSFGKEEKLFKNVSSFRVIRKNSLRNLNKVPGGNLNLDSILAWETDKIDIVSVQFEFRKFGKSNYSVLRLLRHAIDTLFSYSVFPLRVINLLGVIFSFALLFSVLYVVLWIILSESQLSVTYLLILIILVASSFQIFVIALLGEYIARLYLRSLNRSSYSVSLEIPDNKC